MDQTPFFHVTGGESPGENIRVIGCCDIFIWRPLPLWWSSASAETSARHGLPASATQALESVQGRLTSTKLTKMLKAEQDIRDYVEKHRPSLSLPQTRSNTPSYEVMLDTIYTLASDLKADVADDVEYARVTPAQFEVGINPHLQVHLSFWATSKFWDLFGDLQGQRLVEEASKKQQAHHHSQQLNWAEILHLAGVFGRWISQAFAIRKKCKAMLTLPLVGRYLDKLRDWAQEAAYVESYLAIRLVCSPGTGALDLQVGKLKFSILGFRTQRNALPEIPGIWPNLENWCGIPSTISSDAKLPVPELFDDFMRSVLAALEEAHATAVRAGLLDVETTRLVVDEEYAYEEWARLARKEQDERDMDDLKATFSMCSFLRALVPLERVWEEIGIF